MKIFKTIAVICAIAAIVAVAGLGYATRTADPRAWYAAVQVWRLNHGMVSINDFDWNLLRVGSGQYGTRVLKDLRRNGATDDIKVTADFVLAHYFSQETGCEDGPCGTGTDMKKFKPVLRANETATDLRPGQVLPHEFVIATANTMPRCGPAKDPDCVLRMQDFNGDGQDEIYLEITKRNGPGATEDETREVVIYDKTKDGWSAYPVRVLLVDLDGRSFPQRPFTVEKASMDLVSLDGMPFNFVVYPFFRRIHPFGRDDLRARSAEMAPLGARLAAVPVFPQGGHIPEGLGAAIKSGAVAFTPLVANPLLPVPFADQGEKPIGTYTQTPGSFCDNAEECRAIVVDLDHDGHDEVILIVNRSTDEQVLPGFGTLFKTDDGKAWRVAANVELCQELVPDITKAKIKILPAPKWGQIRMGRDLYPIWPNPWCNTGMHLE